MLTSKSAIVWAWFGAALISLAVLCLAFFQARQLARLSIQPPAIKQDASIDPAAPVAPVQNSPVNSAITTKPQLQVLNTEVGYLNVRQAPVAGSQVIAKIKPGEIYSYTNQKGQWYEIILSNGQPGWVSQKYVKLRP